MAEPLAFDAVITPNRSLPLGGFRWLMIVLIVVNLVLAGVFWAMGALPVPIFLGLDVLGLYIAFRVSYRAAREAERVQVSLDEVTVLKEAGGASRLVWRSPTAFTRVEVEQAGEHEARVRLALSGRRREIGRALSPDERVEMARALEAAIGRARSPNLAHPRESQDPGFF
jgi:uncharacterized membrane protein